MRLKIPFTNRQLAKIATYGAVFIGGNCTLMYYLVNQRFHQSEYFATAAGEILSNKPLVEYLGTPVKFGNPDLRKGSMNFSTATEAQFNVPIKGSNMKGFMKFTAERKELQNEDCDPVWKWNLTSLEVTVDDRPNEKVVLVRKTESF